ncbi:hypothetical protein SAMN05421788_112182 [Filimonas lacunae]|uniref:DUF763 domain-containing protein n=1 Tax=Filimonas lacunae TaxID=477680 RepID=A0A173ML51_9BACT|nr:DUF763 domain-containing protein [Filimonas lacunae]BAV08375.1 hypothetical protein FLA_4411 [Filimonas lacunae]SIT33470.1 hypothetical protein SAMN05421788_112182 [Filimonas lacunae]
MKRSGTADLPLHSGAVPPWLAQRMAKLGLAITEAIITEYGKAEVLRRLSDPFWFQSLGAVMGMDWHSSGITTSVMGALKKSINPLSKELGIYICGGKGKHSRQTPAELLAIGEKTGLDGHYLSRCSKLSAKVDNTAIQDGFQLYLHSFIVSDEGHWAVVQQGMRENSGTARRYHWHSPSIQSFVEEPHTAICGGANAGMILNMTHHQAASARQTVLQMADERPEKIILETQRLLMPGHHEVRAKDVDLKRLGSVLWLAHDKRPADFAELLLLEGVGPRTLRSLALVSEVIYGAPSRFKDPARFSFAHGGKDGHPFPVPETVYDDTIRVLQNAVEKAKIDRSDKLQAIKKLTEIAQQAEQDFTPNARFDELIEKERNDSWKYQGRTVMGKAQPPASQQLNLF